MAKTTKTSELSRDAVIDRAVAIADAEGLEAVTIRRLGQEFGVTPMALYWHVRNKDELLAAMGDRVFAGIDLSDATGRWDGRLQQLMVGLVNGLRRHPALLPLAFERVLISPDGLELTEAALQILRDGGFSAREAANIAAHALRTAVGLISDEPGAARPVAGVSAPDLAQRLEHKRAYLTTLPGELYPRLLESADDLLDCNDQGAYDDFGINLFVAGVRSLATK